MSTLDAFLHPVDLHETREVIVSRRFINNETGELQPMTIKPITQAENERLIRACTRRLAGDALEFDSAAYHNRLLTACTVTPDFTDAALCKACGVVDPTDVPARLLLAGEYQRLLDEVELLCGFGTDDLGDKAKKS